jgi:hypothetical protein
MPLYLMLCEKTFAWAVLHAVGRAVAWRVSVERYGMGRRSVYLGVRFVDDVTLGRDCSIRSWPSSSLIGLGCT